MENRSAKPKEIHPSEIAPCGMNCRLCRAYVRKRKACPGCRGDDSLKTSRVCIECRIKNCENIAKAEARYCFDCGGFPCATLSHLDKRYRTKYGMSMIENLENLRELGIDHFVRAEKERWTCPGCGAVVCVHEPRCLSCQREWR